MQGSKTLAPICFPFPALFLCGTLTQHAGLRGGRGPPVLHWACEWCECWDIKERGGDTPRLSLSLACAWTKEAPCDLRRDTHTPAVWPDTASREASGLLFTPGLLLSLDFLCNSEIKPSELILSREKRERKPVFQFWSCARSVD